jgi:hypothetical protein
MLVQLKQRIRVFCLTCGSALAALIWLLCLTALLFYMYTIYHNTEMLTIVFVYMAMSVIGVICFGYLVCDWYSRGRDKRSNSDFTLPV